MLSLLRTIQNLQKQLQQLDKALSTSFTNLKRDLSNQAKSLEQLQRQQPDIDSLKQSLKSEILQEIRKELHTGKNPARKVFGNRSVSIRQTQNANKLSTLHLRILKRLMILQMESGKRTISMRDLASELYPNKPYTSIKTTLSRYIKGLHQEGFVEKMLSGRLFLSYTEEALQFADDQRLNRMKELISKPLENR